MANRGKDKILMFRKLGDKKAAAKLALQTEHKWKYERKSDSTATKDGSIISDKGLEVTLSIEAVATRDELNLMLKDSVVNGYKQESKYPALYAQGSLNSWEVPENVEDLETVSTEMAIEGKPVTGYATLSDAQIAEINYAFTDTTETAGR